MPELQADEHELQADEHEVIFDSFEQFMCVCVCVFKPQLNKWLKVVCFKEAR